MARSSINLLKYSCDLMNYRSCYRVVRAYLIESEDLLRLLALFDRADLPPLVWAIHCVPGRAHHAGLFLLAVFERVIHYGF